MLKQLNKTKGVRKLTMINLPRAKQSNKQVWMEWQRLADAMSKIWKSPKDSVQLMREERTR